MPYEKYILPLVKNAGLRPHGQATGKTKIKVKQPCSDPGDLGGQLGLIGHERQTGWMALAISAVKALDKARFLV